MCALGKVTEARSHFSLWAAMKAPLIIGTDVTNITQSALNILTNTEAIAVNQDRLAVQARVVWSSAALAKLAQSESKLPSVPAQSVWAGPLENGAFTVVLFNAAETAAEIELTRSMLETAATFAPSTPPQNQQQHMDDGNISAEPAPRLNMRDIWGKKSLGVFTSTFKASVGPHDVLFMTLRPLAVE